MSGTREENFFMARLAEQSERFEDMVEYTKRVANMDKELDLDERNLLSVAYKNAVGARRQAWRAIRSFEQSDVAANPAVLQAISGYRVRVEEELTSKCKEVLGLLANQLVPNATDVEARVFYLKMQGDYHRYLAEFTTGDVHAQATQGAHRSYEEAMKVAEASLPPTHSIRLGLALNFSVFHFEVERDPNKAAPSLQGDYHRYLAEFTTGDVHAQATQGAHRSYEEAMKVAEASLPPTHSIRLGLALNFSVFHFEVERDPNKASSLAASALKQATDNMNPDDDIDGKEILELLRDNLDLWRREEGKAPQDGTAVEDL
eukprot:CAMPEP_0197945444 /NCGR_PEP_ID=MMETSP1439-20131203/125914_1 /TAXON_ID=66791 /ORGANISM="Gonyaulax spinifera, Strain CCMP409" /LENGTH=316 /DNA_ID=CAMNT_0043568699 /DNA_START=82 /DNA_END=1033 /DNA_ORIENTATION=+